MHVFVDRMNFRALQLIREMAQMGGVGVEIARQFKTVDTFAVSKGTIQFSMTAW